MKEIEWIKNFFPNLRLLDYIIKNEPLPLKELTQHFSKSRSTYDRLLREFMNFGLVEKLENSPKIKKNAQFIYRSTPKLQLILNIVFHWIGDLTLRDNNIELTDPLNLEFLNECNSFFSDVLLPAVKEWIVAEWDKYSDPLSFSKDFSGRVLHLMNVRLEDIVFKRIAGKSYKRQEILEEI